MDQKELCECFRVHRILKSNKTNTMNMKKTVEEYKNLAYWENNATDLIMTTPIGMLRYVKELEKEVTRLQKENEEFRKSLKTIRDSFYTDGESDQEKIDDLKAIAFNVLYEIDNGIKSE